MRVDSWPLAAREGAPTTSIGNATAAARRRAAANRFRVGMIRGTREDGHDVEGSL